MQDLELIKVSPTKQTSLEAYLKKMRKKAYEAPSLDEITQVVEEVRAKRYAKK